MTPIVKIQQLIKLNVILMAFGENELSIGEEDIMPSLLDSLNPFKQQASEFQQAVAEIGSGSAKIYSAGRNATLAGIKKVSLEEHAQTVHEFVKSNESLIVFGLYLLALWQNSILFLVGTVAGVLSSEIGVKTGLQGKSIQFLQDTGEKAEFGYIFALATVVLTTWQRAFMTGFHGGNAASNFVATNLHLPTLPSFSFSNPFIGG